ncbi:hypothetical protein FBU30_004187 [Linnemannia zychae]|nr:hypothetical protein FBU30_004187 [Linnemannia zychae]
MANSSSSTSSPASNGFTWTNPNKSTHASPTLAPLLLSDQPLEVSSPIQALIVDISAMSTSMDSIINNGSGSNLFDSFNLDVNGMSVLTNTVAPQDFRLYDKMDPTAFDFPLFGDTFKQQKLKQVGVIHQQMTDEDLSHTLEMQQQQQIEQPRFVQVQASIGQPSTITAGPLRDTSFFPADMTLSPPLSIASSGNKGSYGFDSLEALMDDSAIDFGHVAATMIVQPQSSLHQYQHQQQTCVYPIHVSDTPLLDAPSTPNFNSPFSPTLDTPAMPDLTYSHVGDSGCGDQIPLFGDASPGFSFHMPLPIPFNIGMLRDSSSSSHGMVAPRSTLLVDSPTAPLSLEGLCSIDLVIKEEDTASIFSPSPLPEHLSAPSSPTSDSDDMAFNDDRDDDDMDSIKEGSSPTLDGTNHSNYYNSQRQDVSMSAASASFSFVYSGRRKSIDFQPPSLARSSTPLALDIHPFISGDNDNDSEFDTDDHQADATYIPVATFVYNHKRKSKGASVASIKRTRPALASPYGGNQIHGSSAMANTSRQHSESEAGPSSVRSDRHSGSFIMYDRQKYKQPVGKRGKQQSINNSMSARPFVCDHPDCGRAFNRLYNLRSHRDTHDPNAVRHFNCDEPGCSRAFTRKHDLQRHRSSVHQGMRRFQCDTCSKSFSRQDGLRRHYRRENRCAPGQHGNSGNDDRIIDADVKEEDDESSSDESDMESRHSAT